jgi:murein DD-endopeptidase MepM/ murein hydrolase activator NlpD
MGAQSATQSSARNRYFKRRLKRLFGLLTAGLILAGIVGGGLAYPVLAPDSTHWVSTVMTPTSALSAAPAVVSAPETMLPTPEAAPEEASPPVMAATPIGQRPSLPLPTQGQIVPPSDDPSILYYTAAGDSLSVVSLRFGVNIDEIKSPEPIERRGLIPPGQLLIIPNRLGETSSHSKLLPDSEVTFSPSTIDFDIQGFVESAGGYLSTHSQYLATTGITSGADVIGRIALEYSVNPRLLLAFLEYQSGWVYGFPEDQQAIDYPMGYQDEGRKDLYLQAAWFASRVMDGYYGWKEGRRLVVNFNDGSVLRLAPQLNAGSVGLMNAFTYLYSYDDWAQFLYAGDNFFTFYEQMFGNPWIRAQQVEPLIPADVVQPEMILPFEPNIKWAFTGGPHAAWSAADVWAALDFAPPSSETGCHESPAWVVASVSGLVVRSGNGVVVIDMDGDGFEQTGWTLLYLHIATKDRVPVGTWVEVGDRIGHPSCEGGRSTGTHVHVARRYNGEWVPADGPLPFVLSGWTVRASSVAYKGWLTRGTEIIYANTNSPSESHISREE